MIAHILSYLVRFCLFSAIGLSIFSTCLTAYDTLHPINGETEQKVAFSSLPWQAINGLVDDNSQETFFRKAPLHFAHNYSFDRPALIWTSRQDETKRLTALSVFSFKLFPRPPPSLFSL